MSKVVIVNYTVQDVFKIPASIDLEDKSVVKFWGVKWNKLCILFVDGTEKEIQSEGWIEDFDYKNPTGEPEIDYAHNCGLEEEEEEEEEELLETKCGCSIIMNSREHDECRCDDDGENWICGDCYNGEYDEEEEEEEEDDE